MDSYRKSLIKILTFLGGIYFFFWFITPEKALVALGVKDYHEPISLGFIVIGSAAFGLGLINLFFVHGSKIAFRRTGWPFSFALLFGLIVMMWISGRDWLAGIRQTKETKTFSVLSEFSKKIQSDVEKKTPNVPEYPKRNEALVMAAEPAIQKLEALVVSWPQTFHTKSEEAAKLSASYLQDLKSKVSEVRTVMPKIDVTGGKNGDLKDNATFAVALQDAGVVYGQLLGLQYDETLTKHLFDFLNFGFFVALGSAMFSLLGVYIAAAAYRAFRIRSFESSLMMLAAVIVMLGQIPFGLWISDSLPSMRLWLLEVPNSAAFRAIRIGASIAGLVLAYRMWFSIESESFEKEGR